MTAFAASPTSFTAASPADSSAASSTNSPAASTDAPATPVRRVLTIGFVGTGIMGTPMAGHLARAGHTLLLHDLSAHAAQAAAVAAGPNARVAADLHTLGAASDIVITMLPNGQVVQQVVLGALADPHRGAAGGPSSAASADTSPITGLLHAMRPGTLLLDTSSAEPWLTEHTAAALAARGIAMVDAPVSGAQWGAIDAALVFMVGGAAADVARVRPLLECMGHSIHHLGPVGSGHAMKCINNCITAVTLANTAEGLVAGKRYGLDPQAMIAVLNESTGGSWISRTHFEQRVFNRAFDDPFKLELMLKDMGIALALAQDTTTPTPLWSLGQQLWHMADHAAGPGASVSELVRWVEQQSGTELTPGSEATRRRQPNAL